MIYTLDPLEEVTLSYNPTQGNYIKTQPLHSSQEILIDSNEELQIKITVRLNYELEEQILKQGEKVKVISPQVLKDKIKNRIFEAYQSYE